MTKITFKKRGNNFISLEISGHTAYGVDGEDIVCAGISCISQTAVLGIFNVAQVSAIYETNEDEGHLYLELPDNISQKEQEICNIILQTALLGLNDLKEGYSDFIELEVIEDYVY